MNLKAMYEKRNRLIEEMNGIVSGAVAETRAMTAEEESSLAQKRTELEALDRTIAAAEEKRGLTQHTGGSSAAETEERAFRAYLVAQANGMPETRAGEQNLSKGNTGASIPVTIAQRIIKTIREISPIVGNATIFYDRGTLKVPVWGKASTTHEITAAYADEFSELTADSGAFSAVELKGYLMGALTLIGKSVINSASIDVVSFVVADMAQKFAELWEKEALNGTTNKATGALSTTTTMTAASSTAVTADELIDLQAKIPTAYQANAAWYMAPATFTALRKLKDANNRYLLQDDVASEFPYRLLGKPVYISDNMPAIAAGAKAILYGDAAGLGIKISEGLEIQLLVEKYATQHAVGVVGWCEFDSNVLNHQQLATLTMQAAG